MALLKYFKRVEAKRTEKVDSILPKSDGPLATLMPSSAIQAANSAVHAKMLESGSRVADADDEDDSSKARRRGGYQYFTPMEKAQYGRRAAECGLTSTIRYFSKVDKNERTLSPSTLFGWKENYLKELAKRKNDELPKELPPKKRGRPLLVGNELDAQVQLYVKELRSNEAIINTAIVMATAEGLVQHHDVNLLAKQGGPIAITKHWARSLLLRMHYVKRRGNAKAKVNPLDFEELKALFAFDIKSIVQIDKIPDDLVINWDHTGVNYVPVSSWTMEREGSKRVEITALDDKRQITLVLGVTKTGRYLPPQLIYAGKTSKYFPKVNFPPDWYVTCTQNHWK